MKKTQLTRDATTIQDELRKRLGHNQVHVKVYGSHLLIEMEADGESDIVARITRFDAKTYGAAFRAHNKRWEPLPEQGPLEDMIALIAEDFGPYLMPDNY